MENNEFPGSSNYWEDRYKSGGTSGPGSYGKLAVFKAEVINTIIREFKINHVIEFGCGDGNQLKLCKYSNYIGLDVSKYTIKKCEEMFANDSRKQFCLYDPLCFDTNQKLSKADLTISLDVIYHLIEDEIYHKYMTDLFNTSKKYVLIYSSNYNTKQNNHVRHREFTKWIDSNQKDFKLVKKIKNKYPFEFKKRKKTSKSEFYLFEKLSSKTNQLIN
ncbi:hypothetical protein BKP37_17840 [Anaerobacillus alkalilacustris]|uniref:Methyltransferase type 11 domain-containing protein n=1 Tax=Anaerobacillus alkalilacustris TaxID=393763 RepID=A0A1S2LEB0_9BACI|nr:class I SAM-dependent methyltransferase [Anaerobacillus alkalilacustris]OIJ10403.1 hypothetical protein BKP37_17840 [Anaerobacillus alkalilacustris]